MARKLLHRCIGAQLESICVLAEIMHAFLTGVLSTMHVQVCTLDRCCVHQCTLLLHACYRMCVCAHVVQFASFSVEEQGFEASASLWKHVLLGVGGHFWQKKDRAVFCVFPIFNAGGSVCVCIRTHTHTAQMGYLDVSPGVGMRHLEGRKNPDGLNLCIHIFVYVYKVHLCMYLQGGGMRSSTDCFFLYHIFSSEKEKQKNANASHW